MQDLAVRQGETGRTWFRSSRIIQVGSEWYFATREGRDIGPFGNRCAAEAGIHRFLRFMSDKRNKHASFEFACKVALGGVWKTTLLH